MNAMHFTAFKIFHTELFISQLDSLRASGGEFDLNCGPLFRSVCGVRNHAAVNLLIQTNTNRINEL